MKQNITTGTLPEILIGNKERSRQINSLEALGLLKKIAPRIYTSSMDQPADRVVRRNWFRIVSDLFPDAVLSHRSGLERAPTSDNRLYLTRKNRGKIELPGLTLHFIPGPPPLEDDLLFFGNLKASGLSRSYLENFQKSKNSGQGSKSLARAQIEEKIDAFLRLKGEEALNRVRDRAREIAPQLKMQREFGLLNQLITDLLGTGLTTNLVSPVARARVLGEPFDPDRIQIFESLYEQLVNRDFSDYPDLNTSIQSYQNFAFFEGYFSNYIEGTEFTVEEAKLIISNDKPLSTRDEDSHDVLGTYQIVSNRNEMSIVPATPDQFLNLIRARHAVLLSARISKNPGEFKDKNNRAGNTEFVELSLVTGTLKKGFDWYNLLQHPFARAAFMMFMVSEVHPFLDGNGRIARVMMNAELSSKGMSKIIIPTVYREDYMGAIKKLTKQREADAYIRMLSKAWEFSSRVFGENLDTMETYLRKCNAFLTYKEGYLTFP